MVSRWDGQRAGVRVTVLGLVVVLAYGSVVHVVQLIASPADPYPDLPWWLGASFISLTVLDPAAAVLLVRRRRSGVALTLAVLVSDALANAVANYGYDPAVGVTPGRVGQAVISCLAIVAVAAAPAMWRGAARRGGAG